jgi:hypothetical protein
MKKSRKDSLKDISISYPEDEISLYKSNKDDSFLANSTTGYSSSDEENPANHHRDVYRQKYKEEVNAIHGAQSVAYTAYTMKTKAGENVVQHLNNVGVTVLNLESLSTFAMVTYMDAVANMRIGDVDDEKCMLYTDRMGRVFNVIISGGADGLAKTWSMIESSYSGWIVIAAIPFLIRVLASFTLDGYKTSDGMALSPLVLLVLFGWVLQNETSHVWLTINIHVWGSNSVGAHVWRTGSLTDYPRLLLVTILTLACSAPQNLPYRNILTLLGALLGISISFCSIGARSWKKAQFAIDSNHVFTPLITILASFFAGVCFPFLGLSCVQGGTNGEEGSDMEKVILNTDAKKARQNITFACLATTAIYICSDIEDVQLALGFDYSHNRGVVNILIGAWILVSSVVSMALCHRLESNYQKRIRPFLNRDETSPVGWMVPNIPSIIIDPTLKKGRMHFPILSFGSDIICSILILVASTLIVWIGAREIDNYEVKSFWRVFSN